jgi:hypothetical protein
MLWRPLFSANSFFAAICQLASGFGWKNLDEFIY